MSTSFRWSLIDGLFQYEGWVLLLGYFDETQSHGPDPITGVAGWLFERERFLEFEELWNSRTAHLGIPFHAAPMHAGKGAFSAWPESERMELMNDLARLIAAYRGPGFVCTVEDQEFKEWEKRNPKMRSLVGNPHSLCLLSILDLVSDFIGKHAPEKRITYHFEAGGPGQGELEKFLRRIAGNAKLKNEYRILSYQFVSKGESSAIGSADLLAWEWQRNYCESIAKNGGEWRDLLKLLFIDDSSPPIYHRDIDGRRMIIQAMRSGIRGIHRD